MPMRQVVGVVVYKDTVGGVELVTVEQHLEEARVGLDEVLFAGDNVTVNHLQDAEAFACLGESLHAPVGEAEQFVVFGFQFID